MYKINLKLVSLFFSFALVLLVQKTIGQNIKIVNQSRPTSIRGLSVVDDKIAWVSGSNGTIGISLDGGNKWSWQQVKNFEKADFRDIEAFSDKEAVIISSGTPALILKTIDGGINWQVNYQNTDKAFFLDALEFTTPDNGIALGDPIDDKFLVLETVDAGNTWNLAKNQPDALPNEAAFAASGTCLRKNKKGYALVTGGSNARLIAFTTRSNSVVITETTTPLSHGKSSQGAFSVAFGSKQTVIVGGDYVNNMRTDSVAAYSTVSKIQLSSMQPGGFQSCVEFLKDKTFISTGTSGTNVTNDGGLTWHKIDPVSYNVCRKAKHGNLVLLAGDGGKIGIYKL